MKSPIQILSPKQKITLSNGKEVTVRELNWLEAQEFLTLLGVKFSELFTSTPDGKGKEFLWWNKIKEMVYSESELTHFLITHSTDAENGNAFLQSISLRDGMTILSTAWELTMSQELVDEAKKFANKAGATFGKPNLFPPTPSEASSTV
jgi:hypothetical protein